MTSLIDVWDRNPEYDWPWWECATHVLHPEECDAHGWYWGDLHELFDYEGSTLVRGCEECDTITAGRIERTPSGGYQRRLWVITEDLAEYLGLGPKPFGGGRGISVKNERMLWYFEDLTNDRLGWTVEEEVALLKEYIAIFYDGKPENSISFALAAAVKDVRKRGWRNADDVWHHAGELIREGSPHPEVQALVDERWRRKNEKAADR
jgi:hypothetical protein